MLLEDKTIFKNSKQKFIQTLWLNCLHKLIYLRLIYKIFSQISHRKKLKEKTSFSTRFNVFQLNWWKWKCKLELIREKEACFKQIYEMKNLWKLSEAKTLPHRIQHVGHRASSITTDSKMASRSTGQSSVLRSSNRRKRKEGEGKK